MGARVLINGTWYDAIFGLPGAVVESAGVRLPDIVPNAMRPAKALLNAGGVALAYAATRRLDPSLLVSDAITVRDAATAQWDAFGALDSDAKIDFALRHGTRVAINAAPMLVAPESMGARGMVAAEGVVETIAAREALAGLGAAERGGSSLPVVFDGEFATQQLLGTTTTPGGRQVMFHAADRMVNPPKGRVPMSLSEVDDVLDGATSIVKRSYHPNGGTLTIENANMPGRPRVIVDEATGQRVITVINPKKR